MNLNFIKSAGFIAAELACLLSTTGLGQQPLHLGVGSTTAAKSLIEEMQRLGKTSQMGRMAELLDGQLSSVLTQTHRFEVIARAGLQDLLAREQSLPAGAAVDPEKAVQTTKIHGLQNLVVVSLESVQDSTEELEMPALGIRAVKNRLRLSCVARIYDCATSALLDAPSFQSELIDTTDVLKNATVRQDQSDALRVKMARVMAETVGRRVLDLFVPASVIQVEADGKTLTINRGEGGGMRPGQIWDWAAPSTEITDPVTGLKLKVKGQKTGQIRITKVEAETSQGEVVTGSGLTAKCLLTRPREPGDVPEVR